MNPKRLFKTLFITSAIAVLHSANSHAQVGPIWRLNGGPMVTDPSCAAFGVGEIVCGAISVNGTLIVNRFDGTAWTGFQDLGGTFVRKPSCMRMGILMAACAVIDTASRVQVNTYNGSSWNGFQSLGGTTTVSQPSCTGRPTLGVAAETHCAVIASDGALWTGRFIGTEWQGLQKLGGNYAYNPTCTDDWVLFGNGVFCAAVTVGGKLEGWKFNGTWTRMPQAVGANITADPHCAGIGELRILCAIRSGSRLMVNRADTAATWPVFTDLGGILTAAPSCFPGSNPHLFTSTAICAVRGTNSAIFMIGFNGIAWGSYEMLPGVMTVGQPSCIFFSQSGTLCAVRGTDNHLYTRMTL